MKLNKVLSLLVLSAFVSTGALASSQDITITVDGVPLYPDVAPQTIENRTMVPVRVILEAMGAEVNWDNDSQTVTGTRDGKIVKLQLGNKKASINGEEFILDVPATSTNQRTLVPVRFIAESLGSGVSWDSKTKTVLISDKSNDKKYFDFDKEKGEITNYTYKSNTPVNVIIPDSIDGIAVRSIGENAFSNKNLRSVIIPKAVTEIGYEAFRGNNIQSLTIPDGVRIIAPGSFSSNNLESIRLPEGVKKIGSGAFHYNKLKSLTIPDSVTTIGDHAFGQNHLESITLPEGIDVIGDRVFFYNKLKTLVIPESVRSIGVHAFYNNELTSVTLPKEISNIGKGAFRKNKLSQVTISAWIKTIAVTQVDDPYGEEDAFDDKTALIFKGYK